MNRDRLILPDALELPAAAPKLLPTAAGTTAEAIQAEVPRLPPIPGRHPGGSRAGC